MPQRLSREHWQADPQTRCFGQLIPVAVRSEGRVWRTIGWICLLCGASKRRGLDDIRKARNGEELTPMPALDPWGKP